MSRACLVAGMCVFCGTAPAQGPIGYSVQSNGNDHLYRIDLATGGATDLGLVGLNDAEGVSFGWGGELFAIGGTVDEFWNITTPPGFLKGPTGPRDGVDAGLGFWDAQQAMFNLQGSSTGSSLYVIGENGQAYGPYGTDAHFADNIAIHGFDSFGYAADWIFTDSLYNVDLGNCAFTLVGPLGVGPTSLQAGSDFYGDTLYNLTSDGRIWTVNTTTGQATFVANVSAGAGWEGLAIVPEPATLGLLALSGVLFRRR